MDLSPSVCLYTSHMRYQTEMCLAREIWHLQNYTDWAKVGVIVINLWWMTCLLLPCLSCTTIHPTAGLSLKLSRAGPGQSLDGRPDAAGSGGEGSVGGILSSGLKQISQCPRAVIGDIAPYSVLSIRWDVK